MASKFNRDAERLDDYLVMIPRQIRQQHQPFHGKPLPHARDVPNRTAPVPSILRSVTLSSNDAMSVPVPGTEISWNLSMPFVGPLKQNSTLHLQAINAPIGSVSPAQVISTVSSETHPRSILFEKNDQVQNPISFDRQCVTMKSDDLLVNHTIGIRATNSNFTMAHPTGGIIKRVDTRYPNKLDLIASANKTACRGAYALTAVNMSYTSATIKLRRGSDSATSDFTCTDLGTLINSARQTVATWLAGSDGFVDTWYDQSGQSRHATQTNTTLQPKINLTNNTIDFRTGKYLVLPDATVPTGSGAYTLLAKHEEIITTGGGIVGGGNFGTNTQALALRRDVSKYRAYWWGTDIEFGTFANGNVVAETYDGTTRRGYVNGALAGTFSGSGRNTQAGNNRIGFTGLSEFLNGSLYYVFIFSTALGDSDVATMGNDAIIPQTAWYGAPVENLSPATFELFSDPSVYGSSEPIKRYAIRDVSSGLFLRHSSGVIRGSASLPANNLDFAWVPFCDMSDPTNPKYKIFNDFPGGFTPGIPSNGYMMGLRFSDLKLFVAPVNSVQLGAGNNPSFTVTPEIPAKYRQMYWLHVRDGLVGHYNGESWNSSTMQWRDISLAGNHATTVTGTGHTVVTHANGYKYVTGGLNDTVTFPNLIPNLNYTIFHIARYPASSPAANRKRILQSAANNWVSGHWNGNMGVAYHSNWVTPNWNSKTPRFGNNWVVSTDQNTLYRANKVTYGTVSPQTHVPTLTINNGFWTPPENSDWEMACLLIYNRVLTSDEINQVEDYLYNQYKLTYDPGYSVTLTIKE